MRTVLKQKESVYEAPHQNTMAFTCLIVLDPEMPFTLPEMKGISGTDGANYSVIK